MAAVWPPFFSSTIIGHLLLHCNFLSLTCLLVPLNNNQLFVSSDQPQVSTAWHHFTLCKAHFSATVLGLLCWHSDVWCYETLLIAHTYTTQTAGRLGWGSNSLINRRQEKGDKFFCLSLPWPDGWLWITVYTYPEPQDGPKRLSNQSHVPVVGSIVYFHIGPLSFSALLLLSLPPVS